MTAGRPIRVLPDHVANKIAAGEVVDRPASVVKELVENALDAGATQVDVEVTGGGRKAIVVSDDGSGMSRDDALLSIERHATSKISDVDDIEHVATLGFRGEALAAISAVSRFTLTTRHTGDEGGTCVVAAGGRVREVRDAGGPPGTSVEVRHLFHNVPARRKFLRSEPTELSHVRQVFLVYALSHTGVGFSLKIDGREAYRLPGGASLEERIRELFGEDAFRGLRPVSRRAGDVAVTGFAGVPQNSRGDRTEQFIFVNGRPGSSPVLHHALSEAYHTLLPRGRHPVLYLYIEMDPGLVDVNVHPTKKEVRFRKPSDVRDAVIAAVREALAMPAEGQAAMFEPGRPTVSGLPEPALAIENLPAARTFSYPRLPMVPAEPPGAGLQAGEGEAGGEAAPGHAAPWSWCRVLGQVGGLYVVMETEDGLVLMDPHAAHERVLYERYMKEVLGNRVTGQGLLTPESLELPPEDARRVRENLALLRKMGFGVSEFGGDAFLVDALPACLGDASAAGLLPEVAAGLERAGARGGTERWAEEAVAQAACKTAVKARDRLTLDEIEQLVVALAGTEMPYTCPHGRPTIIHMGFDELHRKFGRA